MIPIENPSSLHGAVDRVVRDTAVRSALGDNARRYVVKRWILEQFEKDIKGLVTGIG
jgi:hypothetical protein